MALALAPAPGRSLPALAHIRVKSVGATPGCLFCAISTGQVGAHMVLGEAEVCAFLDHRPLFWGHVLLIPRAHHEQLADLPPSLLVPVFAAAQRLARALVTALDADGSFVAMNNLVSQSVPHFHIHVVPRRRKDGLRGFFWPRQRYPDEQSMAEVAGSIRSALDQ